jgi:hypothetical protein
VTSSDEHKKCVIAADDASSRDPGAYWAEVQLQLNMCHAVIRAKVKTY